VDANPGNGICETAPGNGQCTLRSAVQESNALIGPDTITLPPGTYTLSIQGRNEDAAATGDLDITDVVAINGASATGSVISAGGQTSAIEDRIFHLVPSVAASISAVTIRDAFFHFPPSDCGGAILNSGNLILTEVRLVNNTIRGDGGAICNRGEMTVSRGTIVDNRAAFTGNGGGIFNSGTLTLTGAALSANRAEVLDGAGLYNSGTATLENVTISGNATVGPFGSRLGAGLANLGTATLTNVTVAYNDSEGTGTGLHAEAGSMVLRNTLIAGNPRGDCQGAIGGQGHNLASDGTCGFTGPPDLPNTDPMLGPLADNGGPTQTHALLTGSPAIDAGDTPSCAALDQRGVVRPADGNADGNPVCDIGAYEVEGPPQATPSATPVAATPVLTEPPPSPTTAPATSTPTPLRLPVRLPDTGGRPG
jgi:hypothetical protein